MAERKRYDAAKGFAEYQKKQARGVEKVKFEKRDEGWAFQIGEQWFLAARNEAGFAHRDWVVLVQDGSYFGRLVADQLASRKECVAAAEGWYELNGPQVDPVEAMYNALQVIVNDEAIALFLARADPKALAQATKAILVYEVTR